MLGELNDLQIKNILSSQVIGRIACSANNKPYIVPITYVFDDDCLYCQTNEGTKLNILRNNPNVCFEVDVMFDMRNWQSVVITGKFEELKNGSAKKARDIFFNRIYPLSTSSTIHSHEHSVETKVDDSTRIKYIMYKIRIKKMTGRFEKQ